MPIVLWSVSFKCSSMHFQLQVVPIAFLIAHGVIAGLPKAKSKFSDF